MGEGRNPVIEAAIKASCEVGDALDYAEGKIRALETALRTLVDAHDPGETAIMREVQAIAESSSYSVHAHANGARQAFDWVRNRIEPALDLARSALADPATPEALLSPKGPGSDVKGTKT